MAPKVLWLEKPCKDHGFKGNGQGYASVRRAESDNKPDGWGRTPKVLFHRWIFFMEHGYYPPVVMHECDNPRCIEITHLKAGDWDTNNKDRAIKGRSAANVPSRRRLTMTAAEDIRHRMSIRTKPDPVNGVVALAREYGVDTNAIYQIAKGRSYRG